MNAKLDAARPLPKNTVASLREKLALDWTYHSNAIEGNTLTLRETKVVLEEITVGSKSIREHLEAINHRDAIFYVEEIVAKHEALSEWQIKNIHNLVLSGIDQQEAGRLLLNFELMKSGYPPAVIQKEDRLVYYDALDMA